MSWPAPTRESHDQFCKNEGWCVVRDARSRPGGHHTTYELDLPDGGILRTRISRPPDRTTYGARMWAHILRDQLRVSKEQFWACVRDGVRPHRGEIEVPAEALPADVVFMLINRVGLAEAEVAGLTKAQAVTRLQRFWIEGV